MFQELLFLVSGFQIEKNQQTERNDEFVYGTGTCCISKYQKDDAGINRVSYPAVQAGFNKFGSFFWGGKNGKTSVQINY